MGGHLLLSPPTSPCLVCSPYFLVQVVGCMFIMSMFTAVVFLVKSAFSQAALMFITVPIMLLMFDNYITRRFDDLVQQVGWVGWMESTQPCAQRHAAQWGRGSGMLSYTPAPPGCADAADGCAPGGAGEGGP